MATILVIDDDAQIRRLLRQVLEREGHNVLDAGDGKEGIRFYRENEVDLIITDLIMPEKEGLETIMELRNEQPDLKIIAMSGGGKVPAEAYLKIADTLGAQKTLIKPFAREELLKAVDALV